MGTNYCWRSELHDMRTVRTRSMLQIFEQRLRVTLVDHTLIGSICAAVSTSSTN
jgi:hypothetical protein